MKKDQKTLLNGRLKAVRERANMSVAEVARAVGEEKSTYAYWESAKCKKLYLPAEWMQRLAPVFTARGVPAEMIADLASGPVALTTSTSDEIDRLVLLGIEAALVEMGVRPGTAAYIEHAAASLKYAKAILAGNGPVLKRAG